MLDMFSDGGRSIGMVMVVFTVMVVRVRGRRARRAGGRGFGLTATHGVVFIVIFVVGMVVATRSSVCDRLRYIYICEHNVNNHELNHLVERNTYIFFLFLQGTTLVISTIRHSASIKKVSTKTSSLEIIM